MDVAVQGDSFPQWTRMPPVKHIHNGMDYVLAQAVRECLKWFIGVGACSPTVTLQPRFGYSPYVRRAHSEVKVCKLGYVDYGGHGRKREGGNSNSDNEASPKCHILDCGNLRNLKHHAYAST